MTDGESIATGATARPDDSSPPERMLRPVQRLRWIVAAVAVTGLTCQWWIVGVWDGAAGALAALAVLFIYSAAVGVYLRICGARQRTPAWRALTAGQVAADLVVIVAMVHVTGGAGSYFLAMALLPVLTAGMLLGRRWGYLAALVAAAAVNALLWGSQAGVIAHVSTGALPAGMHANAYFVGLIATLVTAAIVLAAAASGVLGKLLASREAELQRARREMTVAEQTRGFFAYRARHEMRAPLAAIDSILQAIAHDYEGLNEVQVRMVERASQRTRALLGLLDDLGEYLQLGRPGNGMPTEEVDIAELCEHTCELFARQADQAGVQLDCTADEARLAGNERMLEELVTNLVSNAIQYTPRGGRVDVRLSREQRAVVLTVADTGIGISREAREHIFEQFYRANEARQAYAGGSGLGLAIVKRVVDLHDGRIEIDSEEGAGATFTVRLPRRRGW